MSEYIDYRLPPPVWKPELMACFEVYSSNVAETVTFPSMLPSKDRHGAGVMLHFTIWK